jgi:pimeloyl-ACP methyl ester carboxylesterase
VISCSLPGERGSGSPLPRDARFDEHVDHLDHVLDRAGLPRATLCGVSFGGWIALRYAARRSGRTTALVLASSPGPGFEPTAPQRRYIRRPRLMAPAFVLSSWTRLGPEIRAAFDGGWARAQFIWTHLARIASSPMSPGAMARRMRMAAGEDFAADCAAVDAPTLVLTCDDGLDRVIPVASTREYLARINGAVGATLPRTGHLGLVTRPEAWAAIVGRFVEALREDSAQQS